LAIRLRLPPKIKVLEASGAIGDGRVRYWECGNNIYAAEVLSSTGERKYTVVVKKSMVGYIAYSNDNGTLYRRYVGYPIISVLMLLGALPRNQRVENALKGIPWKRLNETYKKYSIVESAVMNKIRNLIRVNEVQAFKNTIMNSLKEMDIIFDGNLVNKACRG